MMSDLNIADVTSPGGPDPPQETTLTCLQGSTIRSNCNPKTTGVPAQAPVGIHVGVQRCAQTGPGTGQAGETKPNRDEPTPKKIATNLNILSDEQLLGRMRSQIQTMSDYTVKTRSCHREIKEGIAEMVRVFNCYVAKVKAQKAAASKTVTNNKCKSCEKTEVKTSGTQTEKDELAETQKGQDAETSTPCWWDLSEKPETLEQNSASREGKETTWAHRVGRKKLKEATDKSKPLKDTEQELNNHDRINGSKQRRQKIRPCAMIIEQGTDNFPEIVKRIRTGLDKQIIGDRISSIRQAKHGGAIIQVRGGQEAAEVVRNELLKTTEEAKIRTLQQKCLFEIQDMDIMTSKEELTSSIAEEMEISLNDVNVINIRKNWGETQTGLVLVPMHVTNKLDKIGRIRVGLVFCRVRQRKIRVKCYRCLGLGHESRNCTGSDRSGRCNKCGNDGHIARKCDATDAEVSRFREELAAEATSLKMNPIPNTQ